MRNVYFVSNKMAALFSMHEITMLQQPHSLHHGGAYTVPHGQLNNSNLEWIIVT